MMSIINRAKSIVLFLSLIASISEAKKVTIKCESPRGQTIVLSKQRGVALEPKAHQTTYKTTAPIFVMDLTNSSKILVLWGQRDELDRSTESELAATEATILRSSVNMVSAVESVGDTIIWLYSFYPEDGVVYITRHKYAKDSVSATYFAARCTYTASG